MQKSIFIGIIILLIACSTPSEITKSSQVLPQCHCEGNGEFTIVMDAGMGNWSLFYQPVFQKIKLYTRVCIIDRSGYAMKEVPTNKRSGETITQELAQSLKTNGITDNLILVGHSLGGLHVRMFQSVFPQKVKGMVLIDSSHPQQFERLPSEFRELKIQQEKSLDQLISLAQKGYLKYGKNKIPTFGLPDSLLPKYFETVTHPEYYYTMKMELSEFESNLKQTMGITDIGDLPLLVIASKNSMDKSILPGKVKNYPFEKHNSLWFELQKDLRSLSTDSKFILSDKNHYLHLSDPEFVSNEIKLFLNHVSQTNENS